jgi:hypothetical protein
MTEICKLKKTASFTSKVEVQDTIMEEDETKQETVHPQS